MSVCDQDQELAELKRLAEELTSRASRGEVTEQRLRDARSKVDAQIEQFTRIHQYAMNAFNAVTSEEINTLTAEGVVDIFQVECGAVFTVNVFDDTLVLAGQCNLENPAETLSLPPDWVKNSEMWNFGRHQAAFEAPATSPMWLELGLSRVIYTPLFDTERRLISVIVGGVTPGGERFYDFTPREMLSSFMVFGQQMNAIVNTREAIEQARRHAQAKNRFLANLSHEIRTPMNAIIGMVQLARRSDDPKEIKEFIDQIDLSSAHLLGLLNDVLDLSKIEEGKLVLADEDFNLKAVVDNLINSVSTNAHNKKQDLSVNYHGLNRFNLRGDSLKLSQVILNLLSNAVKFTPENGRISLDIKEVNQEAGKIFLRFSVTDNGIGLTQDFLERAFTPFEQADSGISRQYGGTGLGLAISQHIIELMGGHIKAKNRPEGGASFSFYVWFEISETAGQPEETEDKETETVDLSGRRALIVDDIDINRSIAAAFLKRLGLVSEQAENGQQALETFQNSEPGHFDLILMDMQMPIMDGVSATKAIRASQHPDAAKVVILAMTANVFKEDVQAAMAAGMDGYISKPIKSEVFAGTVRKALGGETRG